MYLVVSRELRKPHTSWISSQQLKVGERLCESADYGKPARLKRCHTLSLTSFMFLIRLSGTGGLAGFSETLVSLTVDSVFVPSKKLFSLTGLVSKELRLSCSCGAGEEERGGTG